jgi:hypothetical protein
VQPVLLDRVEPVLGRQAFDGEYHRRMRAEALARRAKARGG